MFTLETDLENSVCIVHHIFSSFDVFKYNFYFLLFSIFFLKLLFFYFDFKEFLNF